MASKKLLNSVDRCVDDNLEGLVTVHPGLRLIKGTRVVTRADIADVKKKGQVTVLCGGGSGHEPAHAGYVGQGMLSAAVAGSVFASPPPQGILTGLRTIARDNPAGCLVIVPNYTGDRLNFGIGMERGLQEGLRISAVTIAGALVIIKNYTGDRLNFGLAVERAKAEGIRCEMVVVGDDCALKSHDRLAGRRGLCGTVLLHKIAGALAEEGKPLEEVTRLAKEAIDNMGTIGLALGPCSVPGAKGQLFHVEDDEMELGLGLHGEAGVKRVKLLSAKETVKLMIDHMTDADNNSHISLTKGERVACVINNLGAMTVLELNIIAKETIQYLEGTLGLVVSRAYCGAYITSLEMAGVSITLLRLNDTFTRCLDAPTTAPAWARPLLAPGQTDRQTPQPMEPLADFSTEAKTDQGVSISTEDGAKVYDILQKVCDRLTEAEEKLNALDSESGDGDCGTTMTRGAHSIREKLGAREAPGMSVTKPCMLSMEMAQIVESVMGGSSGGLYSLFFTSAANGLQKDISGKSWLQALVNGIQAIQKYGGAEPGDRTMLDALCPARDTLQDKLTTMSALDAFREAVKAAEAAAEATKSMKARAGRASYVNPEHLKGPDPGATAVAVWLRAVLDGLV